MDFWPLMLKSVGIWYQVKNYFSYNKMRYEYYDYRTSTDQRGNINTAHPFSIYINARDRVTDTSKAYLVHTGRIMALWAK